LSLMRTAIVISLVRCFVAPDWVPTDCAFAIDGELGPIAREELGDARIHRAPEYGWLRLPRSMLSRPPRALLPDATSSGSEDGPEPALDLVGSLVQAVRPLLVRGAPSIRDAAELTGTSVRSLQRELAHAGSSYRDVLLQVKLDAARELLRQPDLKIRDVAYETGFSAPAHFTRFFRALSGVTPREYRASHLQEPG
jgi:AraC-like DNA-binding protein